MASHSDWERESILMCWSPYPHLLGMSLNWWVPLSIAIVMTSIYLTRQNERSTALSAVIVYTQLPQLALSALGYGSLRFPYWDSMKWFGGWDGSADEAIDSTF